MSQGFLEEQTGTKIATVQSHEEAHGIAGRVPEPPTGAGGGTQNVGPKPGPAEEPEMLKVGGLEALGSHQCKPVLEVTSLSWKATRQYPRQELQTRRLQDMEALPASSPAYVIQAASLLVGTAHIRGGASSQLAGLPVNHPQTRPQLCSWGWLFQAHHRHIHGSHQGRARFGGVAHMGPGLASDANRILPSDVWWP